MRHNNINPRKEMLERANHFLKLARKEQNVGYAYSARETYEAFGCKDGIAAADKVIEDLIGLSLQTGLKGAA